MTSMEILEESLAASEKTIADLILQSYCVLNKQFKLVESRVKRSQAYHNLIDVYCKDQYRAADGVDRNSTMVRLNVGGKVHIIKRSTMRSEGNNMNTLYLMISGRWDYLLPRDRNGVIFIDLDPALIRPILDNFRFRSNGGTNEQLIPRISIDKKATFDDVVSYYRIGDIAYGGTGLSEASRIERMNDPKYIQVLHSFLPSNFIKMRLKFELLYRGSRDGMTAAAFHRLCDGKNDTVCVIKDSNGNVFGGFADKAWSMQSSYVKSDKSFLFSLKSSLGNEVVKFPVRTEGYQHALLHQPNSLCAFGYGDLLIVPLPGQSSISIGKSYQNPSTEYSRQYCTGGHQNFQLHEIEVYQIIQEGPKAQSKLNADDMHISLTSFTKTEQSPLGAVPEPTEISTIYSTQTSLLSSNLLHLNKVAQMAEEELLHELMWIEHLSVPMCKRTLSAGLLAEWQRICEESVFVLPLSNGVVVTSCGSETLERVEESMERLGIKVGLKRRRDSSEVSAKSSAINKKIKSVVTDKAHTAVDDVISFNVGGTIIAVLRSTLLLQAPNSSFAAKYSDRWIQQPDEVDECGNIYMVRKIWHHSICIISSSSVYFPSSTGMTS